jgi:hypothetical protein
MLKPLILSALVVGTAVVQTRQVPADFAVRIEFGCNGFDVLDTAKGTYERQMSRPPRQVARIAINGELKERWFRLVNEARFFDISSKSLDGVGLCEPSTHMTMTVLRNGRRHTVRWEDCAYEGLPDEFRPNNEEYWRIQALSSEILKDVSAMPSVARLRPADLFCL